MLEVQNIECVKGHEQLFSGFNLTVKPKQIIQITGENGSGKTSLLRILIGLSEPESGDALWHGNSVFANSATYRAEMAYLGHLNGLKSGLTALENLSLQQALVSDSTQTIREDSASKALVNVGLDGYQSIYADQLSAGQKRRVALARLALSSATLWILDEPITAIDSAGVDVFEQMIAEHADNGGMVILTSHQDMIFRDSDFSQVQIDVNH